MVAFKRLDRKFDQGDPEFWKEIMMLSLFKHENIVSLLGYCDDCDEKILVYEYLPRKSLDRYLKSSDLTWVLRLKICIGAARGLEFLHTPVGNQQRVLHRDIKSSNILLDESWNAKISDFGLSKFGPVYQKYTFLVSHPVGTIGYCDPLYAQSGLLTKESDVYSFGVVLCEVLCGRLCTEHNNDRDGSFVELARQSYRQSTVDQIVYENIRGDIDPDSLKTFMRIVYQCLELDREQRPLITKIVTELESALAYQVSQPSIRYPQRLQFEYPQIQFATNNFDETSLVGHGVFGKVYKGNISLGSYQVVAAIKLLDSMSSSAEFWALEMIHRVHHLHIVPLFGYCKYGKEMILIYEFISNGSLDDHLHKHGTPLSWVERLKICIGAACGLDYLHTWVPFEVVHGNLTSSNILLNENWVAKISDIGSARIGPTDETYTKKVVKGTLGYIDPNYYTTGILTKKTDVYAFGVVLFEVLCRKGAVDSSLDEGQYNLAIWARESIIKGKLEHIIDSDIRGQIAPKCLKEFVRIAETCLHSSTTQRATMAEVAASLEMALTLQEKFDGIVASPSQNCI
ncbi:protein kinase-like domain-containing protein [Artemisia annua]|uniref:Protein kinase-like domain-containing protein n=1 Tax=Artemisia annua TaxID=35608 RepID=A0A2U1MWR9_ARTAN|nr:protein kinase-like domain-containing protein [Artemisia annua]